MGTNAVELKGQDERNLARLGLILGPRRLAGILNRWERKLTIDTLGTIEIICVAQPGAVVPHGIDNDIMVGLINGLVAAGAPSNGRISITAAQLLQYSGISKGGKYYKDLPEILARLRNSTFEIIESWFDGRKFRRKSVTFSLINLFSREDNADVIEGLHLFQARSRLVVEIGSPIVDSIRSGNVRALDMDFYSQLSQPLVRSLYRQLEERRIPFNAPASRTFSVLLSDWGAQMGLHCERASEMRKSLLRAHEELIERHYLRSADIEGRGRNQVIHYHFADQAPLPSQKHVLLLTERGISAARANELARLYVGERIEQAASRYDELKAAGQAIHNPGGYLTSILQEPDKYLPVQGGTQSRVPKSVAVTVDAPPLASHAPARRPNEPEEGQDPLSASRGVLKALVGQGKLTEGEMLACLGLLEQNRVSPAEVTMLGVPKKKITPSEQLISWMKRPVPLL